MKHRPNSKSRIRYSGLLASVAEGKLWSAYIDDTGPGGRSVAPLTLPHDRETHVAAIFPPHAGAALMDQMPGVLQELHSAGGEDEFHFSRIYNGSGPYRALPIATRLAFFDFFAEISVSQGLRFLNQSIDASTSANVLQAAAATLPAIPGLLDPKSNKDLSRLLLFIKLRRHLLAHLPSSECAPVFIDEGWKANGCALSVPAWNPPFYEGLIMSASSRDLWGLQLADFAGFVLTRSQILAGREMLSALDVSFLEMAAKILPLFDSVAVEEVDLEPASPDAAG